MHAGLVGNQRLYHRIVGQLHEVFDMASNEHRRFDDGRKLIFLRRSGSQLDLLRTNDQGCLGTNLVDRLLFLQPLGSQCPGGEHPSPGNLHGNRIRADGRDLQADDVGLSDEIRHEYRLRIAVDLERRPDLFDPTLVHDHDSIRHRQSLRLIVGDIEAGDAEILLNLANLGPHVDSQLRIKVGKGFIHQQEAWLHNDHPSQRDALLLSPAQLIGESMLGLLQPDKTERFPHFGFYLAILLPSRFQPICDVVIHAHMRKQRVGLEHEPDAPLVHRDVSHILSFDGDPTACGQLESGDHPEGRGLPAPRRAQKRYQFALLDRKTYSIHRKDGFAIFLEELGNTNQLKRRFVHRKSPETE
ncbi:MAG: hypothetical protein BWY50_00717 [Spirochaetes bacterium ADurb.Bin315]|nr:MAG: hypothetical protein BWY50_00717 [Spirochaetes bacterium ADurb.Bin315]